MAKSSELVALSPLPGILFRSAAAISSVNRCATPVSRHSNVAPSSAFRFAPRLRLLRTRLIWIRAVSAKCVPSVAVTLISRCSIPTSFRSQPTEMTPVTESRLKHPSSYPDSNRYVTTLP
uniref:Putative secreted protein n=1 Tax=Anopheles darlingi TaxID=43151 RepID=A0A2M4CZY8_ANODA